VLKEDYCIKSKHFFQAIIKWILSKRIFFLGILFIPLLALGKEPIVQHYELSNGLQVLVRVNKRAPVAVFQIWYKVGSSNEYAGITGISHVLEHLMFTGTKRFPAGQIENLIRAQGGEQNAITSQDYTLYYQILPVADLALSFKVESDRMVNLILTQANLQKALAVVKEEKKLRIDNNPQAVTLIHFNALAFIASPYQHPAIGWMNDLNNLQLSAVENWYKTWYVPNNAIIVVAGDVNPKTVYQLAQKYFNAIPARPLPARPTADTTSEEQFGKRAVVLRRAAKLPFLIIGYNVPNFYLNKQLWQAYALYIAQAALVGSESARLQTELVRNKAMAADVAGDYKIFSKYPTEFMLFAIPAENQSLKTLKHAMLQQVALLQTQPLSAQELNRIKAQITADRVYERDSLFQQAKEVGYLAVLGLPWWSAENFVTNIEAVTPAEVQAVAKKYFVPERLTIAELKPV